MLFLLQKLIFLLSVFQSVGYVLSNELHWGRYGAPFEGKMTDVVSAVWRCLQAVGSRRRDFCVDFDNLVMVGTKAVDVSVHLSFSRREETGRIGAEKAEGRAICRKDFRGLAAADSFFDLYSMRPPARRRVKLERQGAALQSMLRKTVSGFSRKACSTFLNLDHPAFR
jgi:hypothetical protein